MTESTAYHWEQEVKPWRFKMGLECGTSWRSFWRSHKFRTYSHKDENGMDFRGFAIGQIMVSWGRHGVYHLVPNT